MKKALEDADMTQKQVAVIAKMAQPHVSRALNEESSEPTLDTVENIARALGLEAWEALRDKPPQVDASLTGSHREAIFLVSRMDKRELAPFLAMLREWPGNRKLGLKSIDKKKKA